MKAFINPKNIVALTLSVLGLVLGGVLNLEWEQGLRLERELARLRTIPNTPADVQAVLPEFTLPNLDSGFPELISRSLFSVNRRSNVSAVKGGRSAMKKGQFVLVGVLITPALKSALLRDVQTNRIEAVPLVGVVRGLTLSEIEPTRVVLRQGAETEELILNVLTRPRSVAATAAATNSALPTAPSRAASPPAQVPGSPPVSISSAPAKPTEVGPSSKVPPPPKNAQAH